MNTTNETQEENKRINQLLYRVAYVTGIPVSAIQSKRRTKGVCRARYLAMAILRHKFPEWARIESAPYVGRVDHSTIYYGIIRYRELYRSNPAFREMAKKLGIPEKID